MGGFIMRFLACCLVLTIGGVAFADEKNAGFEPLFNGKDLTGWEPKQENPKAKDKDFWVVKEGGILACRAGTGWLGTKKEYGDFILRLEWKVAEGGNSGVFLRVPGVKEGVSPSATGMEIQVLDDNAAQYKGKLKPYQYSGSIYTFVPCSKKVFKGAGVWNSFEITCKGDLIKVVYNGETVAEADASKDENLNKRPKKGLIGLQNHGSACEYRNVMIKELTK